MTNQEASEILQGIYPTKREVFSGEYPHVADAIDLAVNALNQPPANWTPCSVGLPDIGEEVDVTYQINGKREVGYGKYIGNEQWIAKYGYGHDDEDGEVLAWRPLSAPYRGEA